MTAQILGRSELNDFKQGVLNDRIRETGRDILHGRAFLLSLLYVRVHENGAAGAQIDRVFREQSFLREILHVVVERVCEVLDERTAAGRAGLVQHDAVDGSVFDLNALHVLAADVEDAVHLGIEERRGGVMGNGLDLAHVQVQRGLHQRFTVAGGA